MTDGSFFLPTDWGNRGNHNEAMIYARLVVPRVLEGVRLLALRGGKGNFVSDFGFWNELRTLQLTEDKQSESAVSCTSCV